MSTCPFPEFPSTNAIPPAGFYDIHGLAGWLDNNPSFKKFFAGKFPFILEERFITSSISSLQYSPETVPLCTTVTLQNSSQQRQNCQQLALFRKVYEFNSNAYVNYECGNSPGPIYYTYKTQQERTEMRSALALVNKLYDFNAMATASTCNWIVPFPVRN
jgi:hypothetical protein